MLEKSRRRRSKCKNAKPFLRILKPQEEGNRCYGSWMIPCKFFEAFSMESDSMAWMFTWSCAGNLSQMTLWRILEFTCLALCPQRIFVMGTTTVFLILMISFFFYKSRMDSRRTNGSLLKMRFLFKLSMVAAALPCLGWAVLVLCRLWETLIDHQNSTTLVENLFIYVQAIKWCSFFLILLYERINSLSYHVHLLRVWWIWDFLLACLQLSSALVRFVSKDGRPDRHVLVDDIFSLATFPLAIFFFLVALGGKVGLSKEEGSEPLKDPLLVKSFASDAYNEVLTTEYSKAGFFSRALWLWMGPLLNKGYKNTLQLKDVPLVASDDRAEVTFALFRANWPKTKCTRPVLLTLWRCFWDKLAFTGFLAFTRLCVMFVGPILIQRFVDYTSGKRSSVYEGYYLVLVLLVAKVIEVLSSHQYNFMSQRLGMLVRSSIITAVYDKGLRLCSSSRQSYGVGQIVNYMSVDAQQLSDVMLQVHNLWLLPAQIGVALTILYQTVGLPMLAGLAMMVAVLLLNSCLMQRQRKYQVKLMQARDERMRATNEVLNFMKIIKLQAWEDHFQNRIKELRMIEYGWLSGVMSALSTSMIFLSNCPSFVSTALFGACVLLKTGLSTAKVFTATSTFRILQEPVRFFPQTLITVSQALVSLDRLNMYMQCTELDRTAIMRVHAGTYSVEIENGSFSWEETSKKPNLDGINIRIKPGSLVTVVGMVGSGKSSLLASVMGEMHKLSGKVAICGKTAFVAQTAWIQNATIEQNILFGLPMDKERYDRALRACALEPDIALMEHGDQTEIGERGINLSGGQKQRIQLARAVYQDSDIYLLDDVFSAVDAHTGAHLFNECILGALAGKTIMLVTHQVEFLPKADLIMVMCNGEIVELGTYTELLKDGTALLSLVMAHSAALDSISGDTAKNLRDDEHELSSIKSLEELYSSPKAQYEGTNTPHHTSYRRSAELYRCQSSQTHDKKQDSSRLIDEEQRESGHVGWKIYWMYYTKAYGWPALALLLIVQITWQSLTVCNDYWLSDQTSGLHQFDPTLFIEVYFFISLASWVFIIARVTIFYTVGLKTTQIFFSDMLQSIFRAPMSFFDTTPSGRILSRFSTDQTMLDILLPFYSLASLNLYIQTLSTLIVTCQVTWPIAFLILPLAWLYKSYQAVFIATSRELTRLDSITKAPVIFHFSESLAGLAFIRCFQKEQEFSHVNFKHVNANICMDFHNNAANEWFGCRLEMIGTTVLCASTLLLVSLPENVVRPDRVGLSLSYGLALNGFLFLSVYFACQVENKLVSVERIRQYTDIPSEAHAIIESSRPPKDWPFQGNILMTDLQLRYRPNTPLVLKGITLEIKGGERIGIVGRTGSGKSTLLQAIFRLVEPSGGKIIIDGIETTKLGLADLRCKFGIIPQEPIMFEGNIKNNIDPLGQHTDEEVWEAIDKSQLGDSIREKAGTLDFPVLDNGDNWSVGQKQLFCLARALLKHSRILFLDEATASIDAKTEVILQKVMREEFSNSTVISIAHRIPSVMDSDKVIVMDNGKVREYDAPAKLLDDSSSLFSQLVHEYAARSSGI